MTRFHEDALDGRGRARVQTTDFGESLTVQSDRDKSEIKSILSRYEQIGIIDHLAQVDAKFMDVSEFTDFRDLMQQQKEAEHVFNSLPSKVREAFDHDVSAWLDAAHDPRSLEARRPQLEKLGLLDPRPVADDPTAAPAAPELAPEP